MKVKVTPWKMAVLLSLWSTGSIWAKEPPRAEFLKDADHSKLRLAADSKGRVVTFDSLEGEITIWDARGRTETHCSLGAASPFARGNLGLNGSRVLFAGSEGNKASLAVYDTRGCELKKTVSLEGYAVLGVFPAKYGWLLTVASLKDFQHSVISVDDSGRKSATFDLEDEFLPEPAEGEAAGSSLLGKMSYPFEADGDVWLIPAQKYVLVRPQQKGKGAYSLDPPGCLATRSARMSAEAAKLGRERMAKTYKGTALGSALEVEPKGWESFSSSVVTVSSSPSGVGVVARMQSGGCRLDVWNLSAESLLQSVKLGTCPTTVWFTDDEARYVSDGKLATLSFAVPLSQAKPIASCKEQTAAEPPGVEPARTAPTTGQVTKDR
ncbi:MAG: hypothetical protein JNK60_23205 [Acidobacteria bacterium]|nr:hypothetical protein [Acidobacteriota bacterium]